MNRRLAVLLVVPILSATPALGGSIVATPLPTKFQSSLCSTKPTFTPGRYSTHGRSSAVPQSGISVVHTPLPPKLSAGDRSLDLLDASIPVRGLRWVDRDGHSRTVDLPAPVDLLDLPLVAPAGEWVELELLLADTVALCAETEDGGSLDLAIELPTWTIPLETPAEGGDHLSLDVSLPEDLLWELVDAGPVDPDHPLAPALRASLEDGALLVSER